MHSDAPERAARKQRVGLENATRSALLDAAEQLMQAEGYAAVTSRRLGAAAGLRPQLVHYYFETMDDLFLATLRRRAEAGLQLAADAMASDEPLRALWELSRDPRGARMNLEFMALANHRKTIRAEMATFGDKLRTLQERALARHFEKRGLEARITPAVVTLIMASVGLMLVLEATLGMTAGHGEMEAVVERELDRFADANAETGPHPILGR